MRLPYYFLLFLLVLTSTGVWAQKTDTVTLYNGDRITCEINNLSKGKLNVSTSDMSKLSIKWEKVASLESTHQFQISLINHSTYYGSLEKAIPGSTFVSFGVFQELIPLSNITSVERINNEFWKHLDGHVDTGFSYSKGNNNLQFNASGSVSHRSKRFANQLQFNSIITDNGTEETKKQDAGYTLRAYHKKDIFSKYNTTWQQNSELGIESRIIVNASIGIAPIDNNTNLLEITVGILQNREISNENTATNNTEGIVGVAYDFFKFTKPDMDVSTNILLLPSFSVKNRIRSEFNFRARWKILGDFTLNLKYYFQYDSKPPIVDVATFDYGINASVGYSF